jgi:hypothetical protein
MQAWNGTQVLAHNKGLNISEWKRREGFGETFEFGWRVELESLEKPQLQLHLRLLLPYNNKITGNYQSLW